MNVVDRLRIERAVYSYTWWLDLRGASARRRRELRRELRANLLAAAEHSTARSAVRSLGSTRDMAAQATPPDPTAPRWNVGASAAIATAAVVLFVELLCALAWWDGAMAANATGALTGRMTLFPGSSLRHETLPGGGISLMFQPGWLFAAVGVLTFVLAARPWRALNRRTRASGAVA